jgi:iron-sulfur cluster assembly protein
MDQAITPRVRRERPPVVTLTEAAAERVREIMAKRTQDGAETPYAGLRVGVKNGGCAGQEYTMEYALERGPLDESVVDKGVTVLVEPKAVLFLVGSVIDYETSKLSSKFVFRNPNETDACGCGESVTIIPAAAE